MEHMARLNEETPLPIVYSPLIGRGQADFRANVMHSGNRSPGSRSEGGFWIKTQTPDFLSWTSVCINTSFNFGSVNRIHEWGETNRRIRIRGGWTKVRSVGAWRLCARS